MRHVLFFAQKRDDPAEIRYHYRIPLTQVRTVNYSTAKTTARIVEMRFITIFFYTYTGIIGTNYAFLDISSFVVAIIAGEYIAYRIMLKPQIQNNAIKILAIIISILLLIAFIIATYNPPMINLFKDPVTGGYEINKISLKPLHL